MSNHSLEPGESMTTAQKDKIARRKLSLLQLAQEVALFFGSFCARPAIAAAIT